MTRHTINRLASPAVVLLFVAVFTSLGACTVAPSVRSWVDERTAVSVTAQLRAWSFFRRDLQEGATVHDFADLGAFEINQVGKRRQYLCLLEWSTATNAAPGKSRLHEDFSTLVVWADDQPLTFTRYTQNHEMLPLSNVAFKLFTSNALESYYEVSLQQLETMAGAKTLRIATADQQPDDALYQTWREAHSSLVAFTTEISNTAKLMNSDSK